MKVDFHFNIVQEKELEFVGRNMWWSTHLVISKTQVTVLACVRADGCYMPPMVVFKQSDLNKDLIQGEVPDMPYGLSKSGWMDGDLFAKWFHFLRGQS